MNLKNYKKFLKDKIFKTHEFDQFNLLFDDFEKIKKTKYSHCVILERSYMYNNKSIFLPLLNQKKKNSSINFMIADVKNRSGMQENFLESLDYKFDKSKYWIKDYENKFEFNFKKIDNDLLMIPNALHHISNFDTFIKSLIKKMPNLQKIYIYDSYLREGHQSPNDYCRYTTFALINLMKSYNFKSIKTKETGNIFDAILYLFSQSKVLLEKQELKKIKDLYNKKLKNLLIEERKKEKWSFLGRKYAKMNTAYSILFKKINGK